MNNKDKINSNLKWPSYVITLDKKIFEDFIEKYPLSIIDFWAPWCAPCKAMAPRLRRLSKIFKGKVAFAKIDIQKNKDIAKKYKVSGIPNMIFYSYGKQVGNITGVKTVGNIKDILDDLLIKYK